MDQDVNHGQNQSQALEHHKAVLSKVFQAYSAELEKLEEAQKKIIAENRQNGESA